MASRKPTTRKTTSKPVRTKRGPVDVTGRPTWPDGVTLAPRRKAKATAAKAGGEATTDDPGDPADGE